MFSSSLMLFAMVVYEVSYTLHELAKQDVFTSSVRCLLLVDICV